MILFFFPPHDQILRNIDVSDKGKEAQEQRRLSAVGSKETKERDRQRDAQAAERARLRALQVQIVHCQIDT